MQRTLNALPLSLASGRSRRLLSVLAALACCLPADAEEAGKARPNAQDRAADLSLPRMRRRALSLTMRTGGESETVAVPLQAEPLLHYSDPGGITTDATIWAWGKTGRPLALCAIFYERKSAREEKWSCELTALADERQMVEATSGWKWTPVKSDVEFLPVPGAPAPSETARLRRRQMNEIAASFIVSETFNAERTDQLRLMPRSLYRYSDADHGLIDGALYAFANGTNPEALLIVECRSSDASAAAWKYGFARLGAAQLQAKLDETVVWQRPGVVRWDPREPYYSRFGPDGAVFPTTIDSESTP